MGFGGLVERSSQLAGKLMRLRSCGKFSISPEKGQGLEMVLTSPVSTTRKAIRMTCHQTRNISVQICGLR